MNPAEMEDLTPRTSREVRIARYGYRSGAMKHGTDGYQEIENGALRLFPMPTVTVPRVWEEQRYGMGWKVIDGALWYTLSVRPDLVDWKPVNPDTCEHEVTVERIAKWADLLANPTEQREVEA